MSNDGDINSTDSPTNASLCTSKSPYFVGRAGTFEFVLKCVVIPILAFFGLIGNTLCYCVLSRERKQKSHNLILKALSIADILVLVAFLLSMSMPTAYDYAGYGLYYKIFFQMIGKSLNIMFQWTAKMASVYLTLLVTLERYVAVSMPLKAPFICTLRNARIGAAVIVIVSILYNVPKLFYYNMFQNGYDPCLDRVVPLGEMSSLYRTRIFIDVYALGMYFVVIYIIPLLTLFVLNYYLIVMVRKSYKERARMGSNQNSSSSDKFTERIIGVVSAFILLESPAIVVNLYYSQKSTLTANDMHTLNMIYILSVTNSVINFYIYVCVGKAFRRKLTEFLRCKRDVNKFSTASRKWTNASGSSYANKNGISTIDQNCQTTPL